MGFAVFSYFRELDKCGNYGYNTCKEDAVDVFVSHLVTTGLIVLVPTGIACIALLVYVIAPKKVNPPASRDSNLYDTQPNKIM